MEYIVPHPMSILEALSLLSPGSSKTTFREWIKEGRVFVEGIQVKLSSEIIQGGQKISLKGKRKISGAIPIVYEDTHFVVVDKPCGWLSVSTNFENEKTVHAYLKQMYRQVYVVHRLDQDTSGIMLFALSEEGFLGLKSLFKSHTIEREYIALVEGKMHSKKGTWKSFLYEDSSYYVHSTQDPSKGQLAITHYEELEPQGRNTLIKLRLETGKKNQIRVHCQENGHPIVGDKKYGGKASKRLFLHAHYLGFQHPITKKKMSFRSPVPKDFSRASF